ARRSRLADVRTVRSTRRALGASLPPARVVIVGTVATPLNCRGAPRARPRLVHAVFLKSGAGLAPLRVRTDHIGHDHHATLPYVRDSTSTLRAKRSLGAPSLP